MVADAIIFAIPPALTTTSARHYASGANSMCTVMYAMGVEAVRNVDALRTVIVAKSVNATNFVITTVLNMSTTSLVFHTFVLLTGCLLK